MSKKVKTAKIIEGHSLVEYFKRFGKGYTKLKLDVTKDKKKLIPGKKYWKIKDTYYQVDHSRGVKATIITLVSISVAANIALPVYFCCFANRERYVDYNFKYWNDNTSLNTLKDYVKDVVNPKSNNYIPKIDRIATFDMDGTLFGERSQIYIEWMYFNDYLSRHQDKKSSYITYSEVVKGKEGEGKKAHQITMEQVAKNISDFMSTRESPTEATEGGVTYKIDLEMREANAGALLFSGLTIEDYVKDFDTFLVETDAYSFNNLKFKDMFYKPMIEVVEFLQINNFDVYIVSGTDRFMVRDIVNKHLSIPTNKVIGMDVGLVWNEQTKQVERTSELKYKNVKSVKVELITQEICKKPVLSFGNSSGDVQMHNYTLANNKYKCGSYMVLADDNTREFGYNDATISERTKQWKSFGYNIFSMKNDWKTIYGDNVTRKAK